MFNSIQTNFNNFVIDWPNKYNLQGTPTVVKRNVEIRKFIRTYNDKRVVHVPLPLRAHLSNELSKCSTRWTVYADA